MAEEKKSRSRVVLIVIAVLLVLLLALGAILYFFVFRDRAQAAADAQIATVQAENRAQGTQTNTNYIRIGAIYQLDQFIVNLLTQSGRRYLKTTIGLEMSVPELQNELNSKRAPVRDTIVGILSSKSLEDVSTQRGKEKIKEEITQRLNEFLIDGKIRNVFFIDFAIQ